MQDLISVIVPVYGVEDYLEKCVESIVHQSYPNLEIILVDDGSLDHCPQTCDGWAERDTRIVVIHQKNAGLSAARNIGMSRASGKYICFIDSDDYLDAYMIEALYVAAVKHSAQITECEWDEFSDLAQAPETHFVQADVTEELFSAVQALEENIEEHFFKQTVVNKLYLSDIAKRGLFPEGKIHEDEFWTYKVIASAKVCVHIPLKMYHSYLRPGSIMHSEYSIKHLEGLEAVCGRKDFIEKYYPQLCTLAEKDYTFACKYHHQCLCRHTTVDPDKTIRKKLVSEYRKGFQLSMLKHEPFKQNVWRVAFYFFPESTNCLRNRLGIGL